MNTEGKKEEFGNLSLAVILYMAICLMAYALFNAPNGGQLSDSANVAYSANKLNPLGYLTANFLHADSNHLISDFTVLLLLLFFAMFLEREKPELKRISPLKWIVLPVILANLLVVLSHLALSFFLPAFSPYNKGSSIAAYYFLMFFLTIGWKDLLHMLKKSAVSYCASIRHKDKSVVNERNVMLYFLFALLLLFAPILIWDVFGGTIFASCSSSAGLRCIQNMLTQFSHYWGLAIGILVGVLWNGKNRPRTSKR